MDSGKNAGMETPGLKPAPDQYPPGSIVVPAMQLPAFRVAQAAAHNRLNHLLFIARGGVGDQVCAEPAIRYAIQNFGKKNRIYLAAYDGLQELFTHLRFERIFDLREEQPIWENYVVMETIVDQTRRDHNAHMSDEFFSHCMTNCVDFATMSAFRAQIPVKDREIQLEPREPRAEIQEIPDGIFIHAGRHWQSKTFPAHFWGTVVQRILDNGFTPILIGADRKDTGTVDFAYTTGTVDLRNQTTLPETIWLLKRAKVLLTNDSAPLHIAAAGEGWIGFIATIKHPDYITHWRRGEWGWRMQNHSKNFLWNMLDYTPGAENPDIEGVEKIREDWLLSWLPDPKEYADWACNKWKNP